MRPTERDDYAALYECDECLYRVADADTADCPNCDGTLRNIGRPRDL